MPNYTAVQYAKFIQSPIGTAFSTVYTCPAGDQAVIQDMIIDNNTNAPVAVMVCVVPQGAVAGNSTAIIFNLSVPANGFIEWSGVQVVNAAETVQVEAGVANALTITASGIIFTMATSAPAPGTGGPPAPTPPATLYSLRIQAETMSAATGLAVQTLNPGYDGAGYLDWQTSTAHPVIPAFQFNSVPNGTYTINIRYYVYSAQTNNVSIDGGASTPYNYSTLNAWSTLSITGVNLAAGNHTIQLLYNFGYTYYDYVELVQTASSAPAPTPGGGSGYNFGSRLDGPYPFGIKPTGFTNATMDGYCQSAYNTWKANRLKPGPTFTPTYGIYAGQSLSGIYYVFTNQGSPPGTIATVSEAIGYGMLITVIMAGYDVNAQSYFDGMYKLARGRPAYAMTTTANANIYLMDWELNNDATLSSAGGGWDANDGDMDIALALLMAHRQWGSAGAINYHQQALNTIAALKATAFTQGTQLTGLPYIPPSGATHDCSRTSDYMLGHFTAYKAATGDVFWDSARASCISLLQTIDTNYEGTNHLPPDWIQYPLSTIAFPTAGCPRPSPGNIIEGPYEGDYAQNAVRVPWRLGTDFIYSNDTNVHNLVKNLCTKISTIAGNSATQTSWAYDLTGTSLSGSLYYEPSQDACQMVGAMVDATLQTWLNNLLTQLGTNYNSNYFSAELSLLCMIVASGNWWRP